MMAVFGRREGRVLVGALVLLGPACAERAMAGPDPERIEWIMTEGDPQVQKIVARHLPEVAQGITRANPKRVWKSLLAGEPACTTDLLFRGEHAAQIYFSPTVLSLPPVVLVRAAASARLPLNAQGSVQLQALLARPDLLGAAVAGRYYGQLVSSLIAQRPARSMLTLLDSSHGVVRAIEMLLTRRVDYVIAYPSDVDEDDVAARLGKGQRPSVLPVAGAEALMQAGVACPRTPWGWTAMRRIDAALSEPDSVAEMEKIQAIYMTEADRRRHAAELQAFFRARLRPMMAPADGPDGRPTAPAP